MTRPRASCLAGPAAGVEQDVPATEVSGTSPAPLRMTARGRDHYL